MAMGLPEFTLAVQRFVQDNFPSAVPLRVAIYLVNQPRPIVFPVLSRSSPAEGTTSLEDTTVEDSPSHHAKGELPRPIKEILATLRHANRPLTKIQLMEELTEMGYEWCERTLDKYMKVLMEDGVVENPIAARPRGYRLTRQETE